MSFFESLFADQDAGDRQRSPEDQARLDQQTQALTLYQTSTCPYCMRVIRQISRLGLKIEMVDVYREPERRQELIREGGDSMVPCLKINSEQDSVIWMYESGDIVAYLDRHFGFSAAG